MNISALAMTLIVAMLLPLTALAGDAMRIERPEGVEVYKCQSTVVPVGTTEAITTCITGDVVDFTPSGLIFTDGFDPHQPLGDWSYTVTLDGQLYAAADECALVFHEEEGDNVSVMLTCP